MKKINFINKKCTGCEACENICPSQAIKMEEDEEGFLYPKIDLKKCIECNLCDEVCPIDRSENKNVDFFVVQNKNVEQRKKSQSGGLFSAIAEVILKKDGICYGAAVDEKFKVKQIRVDNIENLYKLQGSKYVQSSVGLTYQQVKNDLKKNKLVLYSGTSCMIAGLIRYLNYSKVKLENLFTCDFICHGVPSPKIWKENIKKQEQKYGKLKKISFRDKKFGWHSHMESYQFDGKNIVYENYYTELFYTHAILRKCCYNCEYLEVEKKQADITMADFWGIKTEKVEIYDDNTGISLAVIHSQKALELLKNSELYILNVNRNIALKNNMTNFAKEPSWRENFWKDYKIKGYKKCLKKYTTYGGTIFKIKRKILKILKRW